MADLHFVDFALIPSPARKQTEFKLLDDFSEFEFTDSLTDEPFCVRFPALFLSFHIAGRPLFDPHLKCFSSSETQELLAGTMRYFRASDIFGREFTLSAEEPLGTYSYRTSSRSGQIPFR